MRFKAKLLYTVGASILMVSILSILLFIKAEDIPSQVSIGNSAPAFYIAPSENMASTASQMWNEGTEYAILATGRDPNSDDYYLIVCGSSTAPTPGNSAPPSCTNQLCVSSKTASNSQANCNITPTSSYNETQAWYAFVCDHTSGALCSAYSQGGSGDHASPMYINFRPTFTTAPTKPSGNPGSSVTFTVPSTGWGDANTGATGKLLVCATSGISNGACTGDTLCSSTATSPGNDLTCNYTLPAVISAGSKDAYVYVVDNLNLEAGGAIQGTNVGYTANNVAPVVQSITINGGNNITLQPGAALTNVPVVISVTDANGCSDIPVSGITDLWLVAEFEGLGVYPTDNNEAGQEIPYGSCVVGTDTCSGATDSSVSYVCTGQLQSYSDPTDATGYSNQDWLVIGTMQDSGGLTEDFMTAYGHSVDVNSLVALSLPEWINYGALGPGITSGGGVINIESVVTNQGNTGLTTDISGLGQGLCINSYTATCPSHYIALAQQKWEIANNTTSYTSGSHVLSTTPAASGMSILKRGKANPTRTGSIYWGISIPLGQALGNYYGRNVINGVITPTGSWAQGI